MESATRPLVASLSDKTDAVDAADTTDTLYFRVGVFTQPKRAITLPHGIPVTHFLRGAFDSAGEVAEAGLDAAPPKRHRGCAFGDFDGDGRVDVVVTALLNPAEIWMNRSEGAGHWLDISLEGTKSNRDGIGARVKVVTKAGAQYNHMTTSVGYASSSHGPVHFGLGEEAKADWVEVRWPSGLVQTLRNVAGDRVITVKEAQD